MSFWNPLVRIFGNSNRSTQSRSSSKRLASSKRRRQRTFQSCLEQLEARALLTSVTGDFNGDRVADLAIGMPTQTVGAATNAGAVQILYGTPLNGVPLGITAVGNQLLNRTSLGNAPAANDKFGAALAVGDFNRDGFADLVVGAPGQGGTGAVYVLFGSRQGLKTTGVQVITQALLGKAGNAGSNFGSALAVGDFNRDHFADLAIGTPNKTVAGLANAGVVNVVYGRPLGLRAINNQQWDQTQLGAAAPAAAGNLFGSALAAGDFNADGMRDLAIGSPGQNSGAGAVNVIYGRLMGLKALNNQVWKVGSNGIQGSANANAQFGFSLAAGDFNDDSRSDLAIGAPGEDVGGTTNAGAVHVLMGSSARLTSTNNQLWDENNTGVAGSTATTGDRFGAAVAIGQMNGDRFSDLAIGAPGATVSGESGAGKVSVLYGTAAGLGTANSQSWDQSKLTSTGDSPAADEAFGSSLAIGDFNGDRIGDLASETPAETNNNALPGSASIIFGAFNGLNAGGIGNLETTQVWIPSAEQIFPDVTRQRIFNDPALAAKNLAAGNAFLAANKTKPGVITTADGLQYKVISNPTPNGTMPIDTSTVQVIYTGMLIDGTVFDASSKHQDGPSTFGPNTNPPTPIKGGLVAGFTEILELMHVGEHVTVYIPANLAYGMSGHYPSVPPNSVIIFDLMLVSVS